MTQFYIINFMIYRNPRLLVLLRLPTELCTVSYIFYPIDFIGALRRT